MDGHAFCLTALSEGTFTRENRPLMQFGVVQATGIWQTQPPSFGRTNPVRPSVGQGHKGDAQTLEGLGDVPQLFVSGHLVEDVFEDLEGPQGDEFREAIHPTEVEEDVRVSEENQSSTPGVPSSHFPSILRTVSVETPRISAALERVMKSLLAAS